MSVLASATVSAPLVAERVAVAAAGDVVAFHEPLEMCPH
jgi:hypothetical protein